MGASTFAFVVFAVLATDLIAEFELDRWQIGALVSATALAGAAASPRVGAFVDQIGARTSVVITLVGSSVALLGLATSTQFGWLVAAAVMGGVVQAFANPATNKLVAEQVDHGRRGVVIGLKQSGVQFGIFLGGMTLPHMATAWNWRWAVIVYGAASFVVGAVAHRWLPADLPRTARQRADRIRLPPFVKQLAAFGALSGAAGTAIGTYLPLYAVEVLGFSVAKAGAAAALGGVSGIVGRIWWGHVTERQMEPRTALIRIALGSTLVPVLLILADRNSLLVWLAALLGGLTYSSWNSVGMLAVIQRMGPQHAGQGSGVVLLGFLTGLGMGAPLFGYSVDTLETYSVGLWISAGVFLLGMFSMLRPDSAEAIVTS